MLSRDENDATGEAVEAKDLMGLLGFVGVGSNLAGLGRAKNLGRVGRAAAATEDAVMAVIGGVVGAATRASWVATKLTARATYKVANGALSVGVHGLLPKLPVLNKLHDPVAAFFNKLGFQVCFSGRTPMRAAWGAVRADEVRPGMELLSRSEFDPEGAVVPRLVEEVFVREGLIWLLTVMGQTVETTGEHPFWVKDKGWTAVNRIAVGDWVWTETSGWVTVEGVEETGRWETVYNFRIAEHHTYFVGDNDWGFSLWAHNSYQEFGRVLPGVDRWEQNYLVGRVKAGATFKEFVSELGAHANGLNTYQLRLAYLAAALPAGTRGLSRASFAAAATQAGVRNERHLRSLARSPAIDFLEGTTRTGRASADDTNRQLNRLATAFEGEGLQVMNVQKSVRENMTEETVKTAIGNRSPDMTLLAPDGFRLRINTVDPKSRNLAYTTPDMVREFPNAAAIAGADRSIPMIMIVKHQVAKDATYYYVAPNGVTPILMQANTPAQLVADLRAMMEVKRGLGL